MKIQVVPISSIYPNKENPRIVNKAKFEKLKKSIQEFPEMLKLRPIIVNESYIVLGGNMRYKAIVELGDWDFDMLANEWDSVDLEDWGLDVWQNEDDIIAHEDTTEESKEEKVVCALCGK